MLQRGKYYALKAVHESMAELDEWIVYYINDEFPIEDINLLIKNEMVVYREATHQEKRLCYYTNDFLNVNKGIFVKQIEQLEKFFKEKGYTFTEVD